MEHLKQGSNVLWITLVKDDTGELLKREGKEAEQTIGRLFIFQVRGDGGFD